VETPDLRAWAITPLETSRAVLGLNNDSFFVTAREGEYVARVYRNTAEHERVRYEHELLGRLAAESLPFSVPAPIPTRDGDTLAVLETSLGPRLAALFVRAEGEPARMTARDARLAGRALAQVDLALARLARPVKAAPTIRDVHPLVPDPIEALAELGLGERLRVARELFERVEASHDPLVGSLPAQIVHGDFAYSNVVVNDGAVSAFLDFEFAGPDLRAADLAAAMYVTAVRAGDDDRWAILEALASGYRRSLALDPAEVAAVPELMRRRNAVGIIHWIGRHRQGIATRDAPVERIDRGAMLARWLDTNAPRLVATITGEVGRRATRPGHTH